MSITEFDIHQVLSTYGSQGNRTTDIEDPALRARLAEIVRRLLGGV